MTNSPTNCLSALFNPQTPFFQAIARHYPAHETYLQARQILPSLHASLQGNRSRIRFSEACPIPAQIAALAAHYFTTGERSTLIVHAKSTIQHLASAILPALHDTTIGSSKIKVFHHPDPLNYLDHDRLIQMLTNPPAYVTKSHIATLRIICENAYTTFSEMSRDGIVLPDGLYPEDLSLTSLSSGNARISYESDKTLQASSDITLATKTTKKTRQTPIVAISPETGSLVSGATRQNIILSHYETLARQLLTGPDTARAIFHLRKASKLHKTTSRGEQKDDIRDHISQASTILNRYKVPDDEPGISSALLQKEMHNLQRWVTLSSSEENHWQSTIYADKTRTVLSII